MKLTPELTLHPTAQLARLTVAAQAWETVFHGTPSGIDVTAAALGGCFQFTRDEGPKPIIVAKAIPLVVAAVGPQISTKVMVTGLAHLKTRKPEMVNQALESIRSLVQKAKFAIEAGDLPGLGRLMDLNQMLLSSLSLSTEPLERACRIARDAGALGAKLTGKGGGGCIVALCDGDPAPVLTALRSRGIECFTTTVSAHPMTTSASATL